jgi:SAM-dependent methyltransferase
MVLAAVPDWAGAMRSCIEALAPGGIFVFSLNNPCFEQLAPTWREHGEYRIREYLREYRIDQTYAPDFHRPLSTYLNETIRLGCCLREVAEPGLDRELGSDADGTEAYVHLPNFLVAAVERC